MPPCGIASQATLELVQEMGWLHKTKRAENTIFPFKYFLSFSCWSSGRKFKQKAAKSAENSGEGKTYHKTPPQELLYWITLTLWLGTRSCSITLQPKKLHAYILVIGIHLPKRLHLGYTQLFFWNSSPKKYITRIHSEKYMESLIWNFLGWRGGGHLISVTSNNVLRSNLVNIASEDH